MKVSLLSLSVLLALSSTNTLATKLTVEQRLEILENQLSENKNEIQMLDWKSLTTQVATGVGIENWSLGPGQLDVSVSRNDVDVYSRDFERTTQMNTNSVDLRYRNIPLWENGSLSLMAGEQTEVWW